MNSNSRISIRTENSGYHVYLLTYERTSIPIIHWYNGCGLGLRDQHTGIIMPCNKRNLTVIASKIRETFLAGRGQGVDVAQSASRHIINT